MSLKGRASVAVATMLLALGLASSSAYASNLNPSVSISVAKHGSTPPKTYNQLMSEYRNSLGRINHDYGRRVAIALSKYRKSLSHAHSAADKLNARSTYRTAVFAATTEREVELEALGAPPTTSDQNTPSDGRDGGDVSIGN